MCDKDVNTILNKYRYRYVLGPELRNARKYNTGTGMLRMGTYGSKFLKRKKFGSCKIPDEIIPFDVL